MSWSSRKKKEGILSKENFFKICGLTLYIVHRMHFQNIYTFTYQKTLLHTLLLLISKMVESLQCIPKQNIWC